MLSMHQATRIRPAPRPPGRAVPLSTASAVSTKALRLSADLVDDADAVAL
jgi:hypothetical protein